MYVLYNKMYAMAPDYFYAKNSLHNNNNEIMMPALSQIATNLSKEPNKFIFEII